MGHTHERVRYLLDTYGVGRLSMYLPTISETYRKLNESKKLIIEAANDPNKRVENYEILKAKYVHIFVDVFSELNKVEEISMAYDHRISRQNSIWKTITVISLGVTVLSIAITIWSLVSAG